MEELIQAAEAGNAAAQTNLGWCYDEGEGVEVDHAPSTKPLVNLPGQNYP